MVNVENKSTLRLIAGRFLRMNRARNGITVLSIILTTLLFTSLFTGTVSMMLSKLEADKKAYSCWAQVILQDLSVEKADEVQQVLEEASDVNRFGRYTFVGVMQDERLPFQTEVRCAEVNESAVEESFHTAPEEGRLPEEADEVAVSLVVLETLGIRPSIGAEVSVPVWVEASGQVVYETFRLCGWWKGDATDRFQYAWVSKAGQEKLLGEKREAVLTGFSLWYKNLWGFQAKTEKLGALCGLTETGERGKGFQINAAYEILLNFGEGGTSLVSVAALALIILLSGYLIIYNIFNISVQKDIRVYGLLKNVGMTGKQLVRLVRMQALRLCLVGIPVGLLVGYGAAVMMAPALNASLESTSWGAKTVVSANPWIFAASALFALATVYLSSLQACRTVSGVSPVEALRMSEGGGSGKKTRRNTGVSWWGMALENMRRNWKRGLIVMLSVAISLVTVNGIVMMVQSYSFEGYKAVFLASDFELSKITSTKEYAVMNGVDSRTQQVLDACPYAQQVGYVRYSEETHEMEPELRTIWENIVTEYGEDWGAFWMDKWEQMKAENRMEIHLMGISQAVFETLQWAGDAHTWEEFQTGDAVIMGYSSRTGVCSYEPGSRFDMTYKSGKQKSYSVLAEAALPYSLSYPYTSLLSITVFLPEKEFVEYTGSRDAMYAILNALPGMERQVQEYLKEQVLAEDSFLILSSVLELRETFDRFLQKYYVIGGALAVVLAMIGIMNFFNTSAASVLSRKRELAVLEAVGMTKRQIRKMLTAEGCIYLGGAFFLSLLLTIFCAGDLLTATLGQVFFSQIRVTVLPCCLLAPVLLAIAFAIPAFQFRQMSRESVVERIRQE